MKVKLTISRAGVGFVQKAGQEVDLPKDEAERLIEAGKAIPVRSQAKETATKKTPKAEKAAK